MAWMIALHKRPEDPVAYQQYYMDVHRPMAAKLPGLKRYILSDGPVTGGDAAGNFFFIALLEFESVEAIERALDSEAGREAVADARLLAPDPSNMPLLYFATQDQVVA